MAGITNRGKYLMLEGYFRNAGFPTTLNIVLVAGSPVPGASHEVLGDFAECPSINGYGQGGYQLNRDGTDFDTITEVDASDWSLVQVKDVAWIATNGQLPSTFPARYALLVDDDGTLASRQVIAYWDLASDRVVSDGQTLTLQDCELRLSES